MKFQHGHCQICGIDYFKTEEIIAYQSKFGGSYRHRDLEVIELNDQEPWSGVRCVCMKCAEFFANAAAQRKENEWREAFSSIETGNRP